MLNVTPTCPNCFEDGGVNYLRISVTDTGSQKLSDRFQEAFDFIGMYMCVYRVEMMGKVNSMVDLGAR